MSKMDEDKKKLNKMSVKNLREEQKKKSEELVWRKIFNAKDTSNLLDEWKKKYLYPFGDIAPVKDHERAKYSKSSRVLPKMATAQSSRRSLQRMATSSSAA